MSGALLLGVFSVVSVMELLIGLRFAAMASRAESEMGGPPRPADATPPDAMRRFARVLFLSAPVSWLVVAALSFGLIPIDAINPIKF